MDCNGCTLCCKLLWVKPLNKKAGVECEHCETGKGCKIYEDRPDACKEYQCVYYTAKEGPIELRPDNCGIVFNQLTNNVISGDVDPKIEELNEFVKNQIHSFLDKGLSVVLFNVKFDTPFIIPAFGRPLDSVWTEAYNAIKGCKNGM